MVDQSPLARTPRSTPAVFVGAFDHIRALFAETDDAKAQGIMPGFFSFNSGEGRCERCAGTGYEKIEMQFLSDLYVTCPECEGKRYQPHALKILLDGKSHPRCARHDRRGCGGVVHSSMLGKNARRTAAQIVQLQMLNEAGLGYLRSVSR